MLHDIDIAGRIAGLGPWPRRALSFAAGAASVLAMAPFFLWPLLFLTLPLLVLLLDASLATAPRRAWAHAAAIAWWFAFGYFVFGLFWIGEAFLVEADKFAVLLPLAVFAMPAGLALFWAAAAAVASLAWKPGWPRVLALAATLSSAEWLRGHILSGFPWNILGYALTAPGPLMQSAALLGIYGLTLVAVPLFAAPLVLWSDHRRGASARPAAVAALGSVALLAVFFAAGALRMAWATPSPPPGMRLRIVQPSIPQREKWLPEMQRANFERHLGLTSRNSAGVVDNAGGIDLVVWPEAAMPFAPLDQPAALEALSTVIPPRGHLASGLLRIEPIAAARPGGRTRRIFNSLAVFSAGATPAAVYDKTHLVPFGEYLPLQSTLEAIGLEQLTRIRGGFDVGVTPRPYLAVAGLPAMAPLICYEAIFPADVVHGVDRPSLMLNVTNDGWFGNTTGPRQHLHQARVRAVEEGIPLVRSANNGISAIVDPLGRIVASLDLDVVGVVDADLPGRLPPPPYARWGEALFALGLIGAAFALARAKAFR